MKNLEAVPRPHAVGIACIVALATASCVRCSSLQIVQGIELAAGYYTGLVLWYVKVEPSP